MYLNGGEKENLMNGKGSKPRPLSVSKIAFDDNWDKVFGMKKLKPLSNFWSDNGKKEAVVSCSGKDYVVEDGDLMHFRFNV